MSPRTCFPPLAVIAFLAALPGSVLGGGIPNGVSAEGFPAVARLLIEGMYECTGTVVGPNTVLTAAHCVIESAPMSPNITILLQGGAQYRASAVLAHPGYDYKEILRINDIVEKAGDYSNLPESDRDSIRRAALENLRLVSHDLGLIRFTSEPRRERRVPVKLRSEPSELARLPVTMVGYGQNDKTAWFFNGGGVGRSGTNMIRGVWGGTLMTVGLVRDRRYWLGGLITRPDGKEVGLAPGDSGGPMLDGGALIGVNVAYIGAPAEFQAIRETLGKDGEELYRLAHEDGMGLAVSVSLSDPENVAFLKAAGEMGYEIDYWTAPARVALESKTRDALAAGAPFE